MPSGPTRLSTSMEVDLPPAEAFEVFIEDLSSGLAVQGMHLDPGLRGRVQEGSTVVGQAVEWEPSRRIRFAWHGAVWEPDPGSWFDLRFEPSGERTRISLTLDKLGDVPGDTGAELTGWFATAVAAPLLHAVGPSGLGDWLTDRRARRPSGAGARATYRDPILHRPNFLAILDRLALTASDDLLEIGCGGGAFLRDALRGGCRAAAIDHSPDTVRLAREVNADALKEGRVEIVLAEADRIPYADGLFSCAAMTSVFGFLPEPVAALAEIHRGLADGGRLVLFTTSALLRGTPVSPEPIASRLHFYEDAELRELTRKAGFQEADVEDIDLEPYARRAGIPEDQVAGFRGSGGSQLLFARKG